MAEFQPSTPRGPRLAGDPYGASSPRKVPTRECEMTPPALSLTCNPLRVALSFGRVQKVHEILLCDETLVHVPITTTAGCEPVTVAAIRMGCRAPILEVLLRHGASSTARGRCGASALHILASLQPQGGSVKWPSWADMQGLPCTGYHEAGNLLGEMGIAAACQATPTFWHKAEQQRCALASCFLHHGADATEEYKGLMPAEAARRSGQLRLANVIEYFTTWRVQRIVAKHRAAGNGKKVSGSPLVECVANVYQLISEYLAPPQGECGV